MTSRTITAFFDDRTTAERAVDKLAALGIDHNRISLIRGSDSTATTSTSSATTRHDDGGFWSTLKDLFMPDEDRYSYAEGLRRGGYLVTASVDTMHYEKALDILEDMGAVNMDEREATWRKEGWTGYEAGGTRPASFTAGGMTSPGTTGSGLETSETLRSREQTTARDRGAFLQSDRDDEDVIPVVEEELRVGKREVGHGRVRVRSYVVEQPVQEQVTLRDERVHVERRPVDRPVSAGDDLFRERTIEMDETREEAVIDKQARVREEIAISKDANTRTETVSETVRRTEVEIDDDRTGTTRTDIGRR